MSNASPSYAASAGPNRDVTTPSLRDVTIKYHSLPGDRLLRQTRLDLVSAGIPEPALGSLAGRVITLTSCIELSDAALSSLPPVLGGGSSHFRASPATAVMVAHAFPMSPSGRASPALARSLFGGGGVPRAAPFGAPHAPAGSSQPGRHVRGRPGLRASGARLSLPEFNFSFVTVLPVTVTSVSPTSTARQPVVYIPLKCED